MCKSISNEQNPPRTECRSPAHKGRARIFYYTVYDATVTVMRSFFRLWKQEKFERWTARIGS